MSKWIKNTDTIDHTWSGKLLTPSEYYEIQSFESVAWAENDQLITDISNGLAIVAKDDSGTKDITKISEALKHLRDEVPTKVTVNAISAADGKRARLKGTHTGTITAGQTLSMDYKMEQLQWLGSNVPSIFNGVQYYAKNAAIGDSMQFQVVDVDAIVYPADTILEQFGDTFYAAPDTLEDIILYESAIVPNMYIRIIYTSTGTTDVEFMSNIFRHIKA